MEPTEPRKRNERASNLLLLVLALSFTNYVLDLGRALLYRMFALPILGIYLFCGWAFYQVRFGKQWPKEVLTIMVSFIVYIDLLFLALNISADGLVATVLGSDPWYALSQVLIYLLVGWALVLLYKKPRPLPA